MAEPAVRTPEEIQEEIAERRGDLVTSINELEELVRNRYAPRALAKKAMVKGKESMRLVGYKTKKSMKHRPVPYLAAATGLFGLLFFGLLWRRRQKRRQGPLRTWAGGRMGLWQRRQKRQQGPLARAVRKLEKMAL